MAKRLFQVLDQANQVFTIGFDRQVGTVALDFQVTQESLDCGQHKEFTESLAESNRFAVEPVTPIGRKAIPPGTNPKPVATQSGLQALVLALVVGRLCGSSELFGSKRRRHTK